MMDAELIDHFTLVMLVMVLKEIILLELIRHPSEKAERCRASCPKLVIAAYVLSWGITLWAMFSNAPAALAGFLAAFAWEALMPRVNPGPK